MKKLFFYLFPLLSIFTFIACEEELPELYGEIYGVVYDKETSEPIRGAEVILSPGNKSTVTGFNGQYEFKELDPRQYELQVSASGYNSNSRQITAIAGESVTCDITMTAIKAVADIELGSNNFNFGSTHTEQTLVITNIGNAGAVNWEITGIDVLLETPQVSYLVIIPSHQHEHGEKGAGLSGQLIIRAHGPAKS